jgi:hypothetical protein
MAKIVKVKVSRASASQGRGPHPAAEVGIRSAAGRAGEQQAVVVGAGESREVPGTMKSGNTTVRCPAWD